MVFSVTYKPEAVRKTLYDFSAPTELSKVAEDTAEYKA
jgi:hypothetical protein